MSTAFHGYALPTSSTTYTPNQFFDVVLPNASRGCLRLVGFLIRKTLGWSDEHGNPRNPEAHVSYKELIEDAGISRGAIKDAIQEALDKRFVQCLRFGQPHRPNEEGFSALYSLKWDETEKYVTNPDEFNGFFAGNGNLTHIPNQFFDYTIPREPLAVVQVIGVIIRTSIGWQSKFGFRRQQTELSFSEIMRRTGINSRTTVSNAIKAAVEGNHIRRVEHGVFDPNAGVQSKASVYAIRWNDDDPKPKVVEKPVADESTQPTLFDLAEGDGSKTGPDTQFKNRTGKTTVQKLDRSSTVQKVDWEDDSETGLDERSKNGPATVQEMDCLEFKKRTDIKTTNLNNTPKQQQTEAGDVVAGGGLSLALLIGKLMAEGIEATTAAKLVENFPAERIMRQIEALPSRRIKTSRTGFLIRAIEMDIPIEGQGVAKESHARVMAGHFYAELGGNQDEPVSHVSPSDEDAATSLLGRIPQELQAESKSIGRDFGRYIRKKQDGSKFPIRTLSLAVRSYGDEFVASRREKFEADRKRKFQEAKEEHEKQSQAAYQEYLGGLANSIETTEPELWDQFNIWLTNKVERRKRMSETIYRRTLEEIESPGGKTPFLIEFLSDSRPELAPSFWEWDAKLNPRPFTTEGKRP